MATPGASSGTPVTEPGAQPPRLLWQRATIARIVPRTQRVKSFFFDLPAPFSFTAGQHVTLRLTAEDGYQAQRNYSIASAPEDPAPLELAIEHLDDGEVSGFFHDIAQEGDEIELRGPIGGHFVWRAGQGGPLLLLGGGSGVVPLMSMIRHRKASGADVPAALLYSARTIDDVIFRDELLALEAQENAPALAFALTREAPHRPQDFARRVDGDMIRAVLDRLPAPPAQVFVCGSNGFVDAVTRPLEACGIDRHIIFTERFGA